ncbi:MULTISPECIES: transcription initiation factor IIB family protein [unclassified Halorhabdus]|uniref:transcription initiation factor IIB family protein n=1 Tax=unclassified Halorhabdus TaxID=2621901 RepID=UPI0023DC08B3|nr:MULTISPECIES: transcription initiation factor IIB family protein [unclassified Halorhabdus]WEL17347.1 Cyclin domain containing protein [Halorhabdus sp. SVX81]WEL21229.1 Cyclin domain containing protein [Halorhabdus sp. BNX81]
MYRARDQLANEEWIEAIESVADRLGLSDTAQSRATDVFLSNLPEEKRSKRAVLAASVYVGALVAGDRRSQSAVAEAADVSRLTIQQRWKELLEETGFDAPDW